MEKKSFAIGGAIGTAVGMVAMLGIALGVGSCANKDKVKNLQEGHVLVQRPKMAEVTDLPISVYKLAIADLKSTATYFDLTGVSSPALKQIYYDRLGNPANGIDAVQDSDVTCGVQDGNSFFGTRSGGTLTITPAGAISTGGNVNALSTIYLSVASVDGNTYGADFLSLYSAYTLGSIDSTGQFTAGSTPEPEPTPSGGLVSDIFTQVTASITNFAQALGNSVTEGVKLFYVDGNWTPLGILTLVSAGIALVYWCFYLIKKLLNIGVK